MTILFVIVEYSTQGGGDRHEAVIAIDWIRKADFLIVSVL
jgi:hypothetical protein